MKDSIQHNGQEVSIVIYDAPLPPRYFKFTKKFIKTLFVVAPVFFLLLLSGFFIWGMTGRLDSTAKPSFIPEMSSHETEILTLREEVRSLQTSNQQLSDKLSMHPAAAEADDPFLMLIKKPYGMQNLQKENRVTLDQFEVDTSAKKTTFNFQIISTNPETKVSGHILVFMTTENGIMAYPKELNKTLHQGIKFNSGETFAVSRLRPTSAEFPQVTDGKEVKFTIYIFNREGDLLLIKETDTFKVGPEA
jgi:hypothetical protein